MDTVDREVHLSQCHCHHEQDRGGHDDEGHRDGNVIDGEGFLVIIAMK